MSLRSSKRSSPSIEEVSLSDSTSTREEEKTIPFLRRLTDMLTENEDVISFNPGYREKNGQVVLGKIVVHDRVKVEAGVLPRYFNHSSFASLRRQLNYFNFTRIGKGRQRGATYTNEGVIELEDILNLKRKAATDGAAPAPSKATSSTSLKRKKSSISSQKSSNKRLQTSQSRDKTPPVMVPTKMSPITSLVSSDEEHSPGQPRIALDLTVSSNSPVKKPFSFAPRPVTILHDASCRYPTNADSGDADVLAGCHALLNFAGFHTETN